MVLQGFNPLEHKVKNPVDFCKRIKERENFTPDCKQKPSPEMANKDTPVNDNKKKKKGKEPKFYCVVHDKNYSHNIEDCNTVKAVLAEKKSAIKAKKASYKDINTLAKTHT